MNVIVAPNNAEQRKGQFVLESQNTTSQSFTVTQLANFTATIQSVTYGSGNPAVFETNTLKAFSVAYDYTVNIKTSAPASSERIKVVSKTSGTKVTIKSQPTGSNDTYSFVLTVPANTTINEISSSFDITIDGNVANSFTVIQAKKTSILIGNKSTYSIIGGLESGAIDGTFTASVWDILESNYVTSSNTTTHAVSALSTAGTFKVAFKQTLSFNEETTNATITLKGRDGVNRGTVTVSQTPVKLTLSQPSITLEANANETATVTVGTTNDGNISSGMNYFLPNDCDWLTINISGNKVIISTNEENDVGKLRPSPVTIIYKGTTIQISVSQKCDFDPYNTTVNIGGVEWMRYNLKNSKQEKGGATFATKLPSECTDDPIKVKSHGRFFQWDRYKSWGTTESTISGWDGTYSSNTSWLEQNDPCPKDFRVPTKEDFEKLVSSSTISNGGGWSPSDYGYKIFKSGNATLEFPAVGYRFTKLGALYSNGMIGWYWSSTQYDSDNGYHLGMPSGSVNPDRTNYKSYVISVRCVKK